MHVANVFVNIFIFNFDVHVLKSYTSVYF